MGNLVVCASGSGSNFQAICDTLESTEHRVVGLLCDVPDAYVLTRAERTGVPSVLVSYGEGKKQAETRMMRAINEWQPHLIALAGFMRILSAAFVDAYHGRIINIHPSLLPKYPGLHAIERSHEAGECEVGITIHRVDHGVDTGEIIVQKSLARGQSETVAELEARIHQLEHETYPEVVISLLAKLDRSTQGVAS